MKNINVKNVRRIRRLTIHNHDIIGSQNLWCIFVLFDIWLLLTYEFYCKMNTKKLRLFVITCMQAFNDIMRISLHIYDVIFFILETQPSKPAVVNNNRSSVSRKMPAVQFSTAPTISPSSPSGTFSLLKTSTKSSITTIYLIPTTRSISSSFTFDTFSSSSMVTTAGFEGKWVFGNVLWKQCMCFVMLRIVWAVRRFYHLKVVK